MGGGVTPEDRIAALESLINNLNTEMNYMKAAVYGDGTRRMMGILEQFDAIRLEFVGLRNDLSELVAWKTQLVFWLKIGVTAIGLTGGASWISVFQNWVGG